MKITGFQPLIATSHGEDLIRSFESLGFEMQHIRQLDMNDGRGVSDVSMKDEKDITVERARQYALDIYNKFRDKDVFFMVYGRDCGGPENTDAICEVLLEEGKKQCAAA